jgi:hypothetical protein
MTAVQISDGTSEKSFPQYPVEDRVGAPTLKRCLVDKRPLIHGFTSSCLFLYYRPSQPLSWAIFFTKNINGKSLSKNMTVFSSKTAPLPAEPEAWEEECAAPPPGSNVKSTNAMTEKLTSPYGK